MRILYFAVNRKHKDFFKKIASTGCNGDIVETKYLFIPSLKALFSFPSYLHAAVSLRTKDFKAKYGYHYLTPVVKTYYTLIAYWNYIRYCHVISDRYTHIMVWNSSLFRQSIAVEIAKQYNLQPIVAESGLLPNRLVIDTKGANYLNSVPRDKTFFQHYSNPYPLPDTLIPRAPKNAKKFQKSKKITLPEKFIFVPFQVDYDTQILLFSPWITDMNMLFDTISDIAKKDQIHFVFKEHPSSKKEYPDLHHKASESPYLSFANGHTTQELIEKSEAVITVNSTVGIEALLFHKRVILLGNAFYAIEGITKQAKDYNTLSTLLSALHSWEPDHILIDHFLKYLYYEYLIEGDLNTFNAKQLKQRIGC
jgi:capsular polysaccharide export protein